MASAERDDDSPFVDALSAGIFARGAAGRLEDVEESDFAESVFAVSTTGTGAEGESVTAEGAACEKLAAKRAAARNIWFSSVAAGSGEPFCPRRPQYPVLKDRCHWPIGHIFLSTHVWPFVLVLGVPG